MQQFNAGHERIAAVMLLLPRISECDEFWQRVTPNAIDHYDSEGAEDAADRGSRVVVAETAMILRMELAALQRRGLHFVFNELNPTGHYSLDLSNLDDRLFVWKLMQHSRAAVVRSRVDGDPDTSQTLQWSGGWRNIRLDGIALSFVSLCNDALPHRGALTFDFVLRSTRLDHAHEAMYGEQFTRWLEVIRSIVNNSADVNDAISFIRVSLFHCRMTAHQVERLVHILCDSVHETEHETIQRSTMGSAASATVGIRVGSAASAVRRIDKSAVVVEAIIAVWGRVMDPWNLQSLLEVACDSQQINALFKRLGALNVINLHESRFYLWMDLENADDRAVLGMVLRLSDVEDGGVWLDATIGGEAVDMNHALASWRTKLPSSGVLKMTYSSAALNRQVRSELMMKTHIGSLETLHRQGINLEKLKMKHASRRAEVLAHLAHSDLDG